MLLICGDHNASIETNLPGREYFSGSKFVSDVDLHRVFGPASMYLKTFEFFLPPPTSAIDECATSRYVVIGRVANIGPQNVTLANLSSDSTWRSDVLVLKYGSGGKECCFVQIAEHDIPAVLQAVVSFAT